LEELIELMAKIDVVEVDPLQLADRICPDRMEQVAVEIER
jgi:hypothetical protein